MKRVAIILAGLTLILGWAALDRRSAGRASTTQPHNAASIDLAAAGVDHASSTRPATRPALDRRFEIVRGTEGFWRVGRRSDGTWWLISPNNKPEFINAVTTVQPYQFARDRRSPAFVSTDWPGTLDGAAEPPQLAAWGRATLARVYDAGFKALGAWSHPVFHSLDVPMTRDLNVWTWAGRQNRFYAPGWRTAAEQAIEAQTSVLRENGNLIGYFIDNELDWGDSGNGPAVYFDNLPPTDPNRIQVTAVIRNVWSRIEDFNADWATNLKNWRELDAVPMLNRERGQAYSRLYSAWLGHLASDYLNLTTSLIRKHDPNHLVLGVRFKGYAPAEVVEASRGLTDAQSINYYPNDARLDLEMFRMMHESSQQPIIISEFSFHALDGRSGNRNTVGFAAQVLDQQARADGYRLFITRMARVPYIVGAEWFQWMDEPPGGRSQDGEDVNFGVVDIDDRPYDALVNAVRSTTPRLNRLHDKSHAEDQKDIWRESFATKPVMRVPQLLTPIRLNGELSDWDVSAKLPGVRHSLAIGLDRSPLPVPNVYLGWVADGLYLGVEVFDHDIQGAPANGWWWARDGIEFWINTRRVQPDQTGYDQYSHQFFFVPQEFPATDGIAGVVGQWHRPGDALKDNLIPQPDITSAVRILADRYVVEMFIPRSALNGFDPLNQPSMAFNIHVRNFQHATDYFWSAPKEVMTQLKPNTWGTLELEPAGTPTIARSHQASALPATSLPPPIQ